MNRNSIEGNFSFRGRSLLLYSSLGFLEVRALLPFFNARLGEDRVLYLKIKGGQLRVHIGFSIVLRARLN
ncbi:MAG: hypothetical protein SWY16_15010 [Cyanobacteriota bacterium]|nr:hypothetical protein [Cyanobacteriota bacterium]